MSDPVTPFRVVESEPLPGVVEVARKLLESAEAGEIRALVFVGSLPGGEVIRGHAFSQGQNLMGMIGAAAVLQQRLLSELEGEFDG